MKINKNILILIDTEMIESVKLGYYLVLIDTDKQDPAGSLRTAKKYFLGRSYFTGYGRSYGMYSISNGR